MMFLTLSHHFGLGRHFFYLDDYERVKAMEMEFISEPFGKEILKVKDRGAEIWLTRSRNSMFNLRSHLFRYSDVSAFVSFKTSLSYWRLYILRDPHNATCAQSTCKISNADFKSSSGTTKFRRWFLYFLIAETLIINLMTCITIYVQCGKVESLWDPVGTPSKCWPPDVQAVSQAFWTTGMYFTNRQPGYWILPRR